MRPADLRVVFMGSPLFAVASFHALLQAGYYLVAAVTQPDRPAGRGGRVAVPAVKQAAQWSTTDIPVFQPATLKDGRAAETLAALRPDLFVVAAYGRILPAEILALPARGTLNVHASLLPRWRGPSPIAAAILAGDPETGVTVMEVVQKMDAGPIISQERLPLPAGATTGALEPALSRLGATALVAALPGWLEGTLRGQPQDDGAATYCSLLRKEDGWLRASMTAAEVERAVRAYDPWPGAYVECRGRRLGIWGAELTDGPPSAPGTLRAFPNGLAMALSGGWIRLTLLQPAGGRRMSGRDFLNGERGALPDRAGLRA